MPLEICPTCRHEFEVPARVEMLVQCPRCALRPGHPGAATIQTESGSGEPPPVPAEVAFSEAFLARYTPVRVLGTGAFSTVYFARAVAGGRPVAVKFLTTPRSPVSRKRFDREMALLELIKDPNVLEVLEAGEMGPFPYFVAEYLEGGTLTRMIKAHGRLPPAEAVRVMRGVLSGLAACHALGIVHRDLKPDNILFGASGRPKITDLGLAKDQSAPDPRWTAPNAVCGTPHYMSPEQIKGEPVGPPTDLYACGAVLYEMLVGETPFQADSVWQLLDLQVRGATPSVRERVPYAPAQLADAVARAMQKDPKERFATAGEMASALVG